MKVAIPIFQERVSPRFEYAPALLVVTVQDRTVIEKKELDLSAYEHDLFQRSALLAKLGVDVLICGGLEGFCIRLLNGRNVEVIASVCGDAEEVLRRYLQGTLVPPGGGLCSHGRGRQCPFGNENIGGRRRKNQDV